MKKYGCTSFFCTPCFSSVSKRMPSAPPRLQISSIFQVLHFLSPCRHREPDCHIRLIPMQEFSFPYFFTVIYTGRVDNSTSPLFSRGVPTRSTTCSTSGILTETVPESVQPTSTFREAFSKTCSVTPSATFCIPLQFRKRS